MSQQKQSNFWNTPLTSSLIKGKDVRPPEMLIGYFIGPIGGLLSSGIFTSILNTYFTDVLKLDLTFLTTLHAVFNDTDRHSEPGCRTADRENEGACGKGKTMDTSVSSYPVSGIGTDVYRAF